MVDTRLLDGSEETDLARHVQLLSLEQWGERKKTALIGRHDSIVAAQEKVLRFAQADGPVLITGETGTGKELFARAIYLLSARRRRPFLTVNCAQYADGNLIASELFGHRRGSFTGAVEDHRGVFEEADGGVVFLDEVGELTPAAQAMLLRVLSEGEVVPVGDTRVRHVDVRVVAATNRDLKEMVDAGSFRADLLYRLRFLQLRIPPLRDRGEDWRLMVQYYVRQLNAAGRSEKRFSERALARLGGYPWPGNVRELRSLVETSFHLCNGSGVIEPWLFDDHLEEQGSPPPRDAEPASPRRPYAAPDRLARMASGEGTFWELVYEPFMERDLNRGEVQAIIADGLRRSNWSYKRALKIFGIAPEQYLKFMDFLRHHRLKPDAGRGFEPAGAAGDP
jgi:transcriptional regulator with GAF, ATPase, and Fis domain